MSEARDDDVPKLERAPQGFTILRGSAGLVYLACNDDQAEFVAVRVVTGTGFSIARRLRRDAVASIPGATTDLVMWYLGGIDAATRIVVHRPFGPIVEF